MDIFFLYNSHSFWLLYSNYKTTKKIFQYFLFFKHFKLVLNL